MSNKEYLEGGVELLDLAGPLWEKLDAHHARVSKYFSDRSSGPGFSGRKEGLLEKARLGKLRMDLVKQRDNDRYIGYCISSIDQKHIGEIESIFVEEEFRNQGIGHHLMQKALAWMEKEQVKSKRVGVVYGNERAFRFYARYEFFPSVTILRQKKD
jgi:ribosomal protein S18 acetylase RimI-like enzyme